MKSTSTNHGGLKDSVISEVIILAVNLPSSTTMDRVNKLDKN